METCKQEIAPPPSPFSRSSRFQMCYIPLKTPVKSKKKVSDALHELEMLLPKLVILIPNRRVIDCQAYKVTKIDRDRLVGHRWCNQCHVKTLNTAPKKCHRSGELLSDLTSPGIEPQILRTCRYQYCYQVCTQGVGNREYCPSKIFPTQRIQPSLCIYTRQNA